MNRIVLHLTTIALLISGCNRTSEEGSYNQTPDTLVNPTSARHTNESNLYTPLKGIYATSTKMPHNTYGYEGLFDDDSETYWATMPGAGPDEGIMLYFEKPQEITHLMIDQYNGDSYSVIETILVYINGVASYEYNIKDGRIEMDQENVRSLYIRIGSMADSKIISDDTDHYSTNFPKTKSVAISSLALYNDNARLMLTPPQKIKGDIKASSTLSPDLSYGVRNLFDSRREFAWAEGAMGKGEQEYISIRLDDEISLTGLKISNGFQRSPKHYEANARLKSLTVSSENKEKQHLNVSDTPDEQSLILPKPTIGKNFELKIEQVYPGTKYEDLVISELRLISDDKEYVLNESITEHIKEEAIEKIRGSVLEAYMDRKVDYNYEMDDVNDYRSMIIRSDYTFVVYQKSREYDDSMEVIADGNWELIELTKESAKIRVFGKFSKLSESFDYYAGDLQTSFEQIFQDFLTLTPQGVSAGKFIPGIKIIDHAN